MKAIAAFPRIVSQYFVGVLDRTATGMSFLLRPARLLEEQMGRACLGAGPSRPYGTPGLTLRHPIAKLGNVRRASRRPFTVHSHREALSHDRNDDPTRMLDELHPPRLIPVRLS